MGKARKKGYLKIELQRRVQQGWQLHFFLMFHLQKSLKVSLISKTWSIKFGNSQAESVEIQVKKCKELNAWIISQETENQETKCQTNCTKLAQCETIVEKKAKIHITNSNWTIHRQSSYLLDYIWTILQSHL